MIRNNIKNQMKLIFFSVTKIFKNISNLNEFIIFMYELVFYSFDDLLI